MEYNTKRQFRRHLYNISLFRYVNNLYEEVREKYELISQNRNHTDYYFHTFDFLFRHLETSTQFWYHYQPYIIEDVSIYQRTLEYFQVLSSSLLLIMNQFENMSGKTEYYVRYLYERSLLLVQSVESFRMGLNDLR